MLFERIDPVLPELAVVVDPGRRLLQRPGPSPQDVLTTHDLAADEARFFQAAHVLGDGVEGDIERLGQLGHPGRSGAQAVQDRPARGVGYGVVGKTEPVAFIFTHAG